MKINSSRVILLAAGLLAAPLLFLGSAHAQPTERAPAASKAPKGTSGPGNLRQRTYNVQKTPRVRSEVRRQPAVKRPLSDVGRKPGVKRPITEHRVRPGVRHTYRRWRPGLRYRWIAVPTIIIAEELSWCHYHLYRVTGMRFHRTVQCHRHARWNHPSIRYVEEY